MEIIVIQNGHIVAFGIGLIVGMILTGVSIGLMIPAMVKKTFSKLNK